MAAPARELILTAVDQAALQRLQRASAGPAGLARRARAVLLMAGGLSGVAVAERTGYTPVQISRIRARFAQEGLAGLADHRRSGRPPVISARKRAQVVRAHPQAAARRTQPLEHTRPRAADRTLALERAPDLAGPRAPAASERDLQVHQRSQGRRQDRRCRGPLSR